MNVTTTMRRFAVVVVAWSATMTALAGAKQWQNHPAGNGLPGNEIQFIQADGNDAVWVGTLSGLASYRDGKLTTHLDKGQVWDVLRISKDSFVVGTDKGAVHVDGEQRTTHLKGRSVAPLVSVGGQQIWAISKDKTSEGSELVAFNGTEWAPVEAFKGQKVMNLFKGSDGKVWVFIEGNGLIRTDPTSPAVDDRHLEGNQVMTVIEDKSKKLWAGTWGHGLFSFDGSAWTRHLEKEDAALMSVVQSADGTIWAATSAHGLWHNAGGKWQNELSDEGGINTLAATPDGQVWISSQAVGGLRVWDGKAWVPSLDTPLPIRCVFQLDKATTLAGGILDGLHIQK